MDLLQPIVQLLGIGKITGDGTGTLYITAYNRLQVYRVNTGGLLNVFLGSGTTGTTLGISSLSANLDRPFGIYARVDSSLSPIVYLTEDNSPLVKKLIPVASPTSQPSSLPSSQPSSPTSGPTSKPSVKPSFIPSGEPTTVPSSVPVAVPTGEPSTIPTASPSSLESAVPSSDPSMGPTGRPSADPSMRPTSRPSSEPSAIPSSDPSLRPTSRPSSEPSAIPSSDPSLRPTRRPSSEPSSEPTAPSFSPTKAPNANDMITINGGLVVSDVSDGVLNNRSMAILTAAVRNISGSAQAVTITTTKLIKKKGRVILDSVFIYSFQIDFVAVYYLSYYSGWNTSYFAEMKLKTMKVAVEDGSFEIELRRLAAIHNATQLFNATCHEVTLSASEITSTSSSSTSDNTFLSDGEITGIVIASVFGMCLALCLVVCVLYRRDKPFKKVAVVAYEASDCDNLDERM
jgi:hypothetical protein